MPRPGSQADLLQQYNELATQARALGISVQVRTSGHFSRSVMRARLDALRSSITQFDAPSIEGATRTFGCEFEFHMPRGMSRDALADLLNEAGLRTQIARFSDKSVSTTIWKLTTDGSLGYASGSELVSPVLSGTAGFEAVQKALRVLLQARCRVARNCGFHVHVGVKRSGSYAGEALPFFKNLLRIYRKFEPTIDSIVALSRRGSYNHWCGPVGYSESQVEAATEIEQLRMMSFAQSKYRKVNFATYWRQGTIEFRHHQGTLNPLTATKWISFILRIVEAASKRSREEIAGANTDLVSLLTLIGADEGERAFFVDRQGRLLRGGAA